MPAYLSVPYWSMGAVCLWKLEGVRKFVYVLCLCQGCRSSVKGNLFAFHLHCMVLFRSFPEFIGQKGWCRSCHFQPFESKTNEILTPSNPTVPYVHLQRKLMVPSLARRGWAVSVVGVKSIDRGNILEAAHQANSLHFVGRVILGKILSMSFTIAFLHH